jgi:ABC-type lipoprotein release transport system permease subunit
MSVPALVARAEMRRRWPSLLGLALIVAIVVAVVATAVAGARRTASSLDRFREETRAADADVQIDDLGLIEPVFAELERLPFVEDVARAPLFLTSPRAAPDGDLMIVSDPTGRLLTSVERPRLLSGRLPAAGSPSEIAVNEFAAERLAIAAGEGIDVRTPSPRDMEELFESEFEHLPLNGPELRLDVVGVVRAARDLQGSDADTGAIGYASEAFAREHEQAVGAFPPSALVTLRNPSSDIAALREAVRSVAGPDGQVSVTTADEIYADSVAGALDVLGTALLVVALVAGAAGALVLAQAITREISASSGVVEAMRAVGSSRTSSIASIGLPSMIAAVAGTTVGVLGAALASRFFPIGIAGRAEPDPGVSLDVRVLVLGAAVAIVFGGIWVAMAAWRLAAQSTSPLAAAPSARVPGAVARAGLGPVIATGLRFACEPGRGRRAVPVRSAIAGVAIAVAGFVGAGLVATSLGDLLGSPARYGWTWSSSPEVVFDDPSELAPLASEPGLAGIAVVDNVRAEVDGLEMRAFAFEAVKGSILPRARAGRIPATPSEIALGARTMGALDVAVGDSVSATTADGGSTAELEVVGEVVLPIEDNPEPGEGALLTAEGIRLVERSDGFRQVVLEYADGADGRALEARLAEEHGLDFASEFARPRVPGSLQNLDEASSIVTALALFFAVLGTAGLAHALVVTTRRRRQDLAILRVMGLLRRQASGTVGWQAAGIAAVGTASGVLLGLVGGRLVWRVMVEDLGLLDAPSQPWLLLAIVAPLTIALALAISWLPSRAAVRARAADALRAE